MNTFPTLTIGFTALRASRLLPLKVALPLNPQYFIRLGLSSIFVTLLFLSFLLPSYITIYKSSMLEYKFPALLARSSDFTYCN